MDDVDVDEPSRRIAQTIYKSILKYLFEYLITENGVEVVIVGGN